MRPLSANEIPPNLSFYAIDPLYMPGVPLGWATTRIEERLDRGLDVQALDGDRRVSELAAAEERSGDGRRSTSTARRRGSPRRSSRQADHRDHRLRRRRARRAIARSTYWVAPVVAGRATTEPPMRLTLPAQAAPRPFRAIALRDDVKSVDRVGIGDLDGDGTYDFVVKHPAGNIDPGRARPSTDTYKLDAYDGRTGRVPVARSISAGTSTTGSGSRRWSFATSTATARRRSACARRPFAATREAGVRRRQGLRPRRAGVRSRSTTGRPAS